MRRASLGATVLGVLLGTLPAYGVITQTSIDSPPHGFMITVVGVDEFGPAFTVSGSSDGSPGDQVGVLCYYRLDGRTSRWYEDLGTATIGGDGTWSLTVGAPGSGFRYPYGGCTLHAIPEGTPLPTTTEGLASYPGPGIVVDHQELFRSGGVLSDFFLARTGATAYADFDGLGSCGLCDLNLYDPATFTRGGLVFNGNGVIYTAEHGIYGPDRAYLQVDGHNARAAYSAGELPPGGGGQPAQFTFAEDPIVTETEPILRCTNDSPFPPANRGECGGFVDTGVGFTGTIRMLNDGRTVELGHTWVSTDGGTHVVDVHYDQYQTSATAPTPPQYRLPWVTSDFVTPFGTSFPGPSRSAPATVFFRSSPLTPEGSFDDPVGAITFAPAPSFVRFASDNARRFIAGYRFQVAPGAPVVIRQRYDASDAFGTLVDMAAVSRDAVEGPSIVIESPAEGATVEAPVRVTGTAADSEYLVALSVNGYDVPVRDDGAWSVDVPSSAGPATITAVATDAAGNQTTVTRRITVGTIGTSDTEPPPVTVEGVGETVKRKTLVREGMSVEVTCGEACSLLGQLVRSVKRKVKKQRIVTDLVVAESTLDLGTGRRTLTLKPTKKQAKSIKRGNALKVSVTATDAAGNAATTTSTIRVR